MNKKEINKKLREIHKILVKGVTKLENFNEDEKLVQDCDGVLPLYCIEMDKAILHMGDAISKVKELVVELRNK